MIREEKLQALKEFNCFDEWMSNVEALCEKKEVNFSDRLCVLLDREEPFNHFIGRSFTWSLTPENKNYWLDVAIGSLSIDYIKPIEV